MDELRKCRECNNEKPLDGFHKTYSKDRSATYRYHVCKKCMNVYQYNKRMEKQIEAGVKNIVECASCGRYMKKLLTRDKCLSCWG